MGDEEIPEALDEPEDLDKMPCSQEGYMDTDEEEPPDETEVLPPNKKDDRCQHCGRSHAEIRCAGCGK